MIKILKIRQVILSHLRLLASSFGAEDVFHAKLDKDNIFEHEF